MATPFITALEIGTSSVKVLMGDVREDGVIMIIGVGECESRGVKKGEIIEFELALESVQAAMDDAEENSKRLIGDSIYLSASGGRVKSRIHKAGIPILNEYEEAGGEVATSDMEHVLELARKVPLTDDRIRLHTLQQNFEVDGRGGIVNPAGMLAQDLKVGMLLIHGRRSTVENLKKLAQNVPVICADAAFGGFCSALAVLTTEQKRAGCIVIDLGGGTTEFIVYNTGLVHLAGSFAVGGDHVTSDICSGLGINRRQAEALKKESGNAVMNPLAEENNITIPAEGGFSGRTVRSSALSAVINARMEETFQLIYEQIEEYGRAGELSAGVILTGGGSALEGVVDLARQVFNAPAQVGRVQDCVGLHTNGEGARFSSAIGCIRYAASQMTVEPKKASAFSALFGKLWGGSHD